MLDLTLRELEYVVELAAERNYTRAAARLHVAQPALSQAILRVERKMGVALFERTSRQVEPTPGGWSLARDATNILASVRQAAENCRQASTAQTSLAVHVNDPALWLPRQLVHELRKSGATVHQYTLPARDVMEQLRDGSLTIAIGALLPSKDFASRTIHSEPVGALMSLDHLLADQESVDLLSVARFPVLTVDPRMSSWNDYVQALFTEREAFFRWSATTVYGALASHDVLADNQTIMITLKSIGNGLGAGLCWRPLDPAIDAPWFVNWARRAEGTRPLQLALNVLANWVPGVQET